MKARFRRILPALLVMTIGGAGGFYALAKIRPPEKLARPHSVIYVEKTYQAGKLTGERIILRTVNAKGEHQKEEIWPNRDAQPMRMTAEGLSSVASDGAMTVLSRGEVGSNIEVLRPLSAASKEKAVEVRTIAGLKAWVFKSGDQSPEVELDRAFAEETGQTPLWSHITLKKTGKEIVSEALRVIWGTQEKD